MTRTESKFTSVEICAGAGGQALGLHQAGFRHHALIEIDKHACATLELNVTKENGWGDCQVIPADLTTFDQRSSSWSPARWTSLPAVCRARPSRPRASSWVRTTSVTCFPPCSIW